MNTDPNDPIARAFNIPSTSPVSVVGDGVMPREVSRHDEFIHWIRQKCQEWKRTQDGQIYQTDQEIGMMLAKDRVSKEITSKLNQLEL